MKLTDEELNKILMKADDDYDRMKDRLHELYEENERLKEENKYLNNELNNMTDYAKNLEDYKSRCEKAIEYINHAQNYGTMAQVMPHLKPYVNGDDLLNILQNGSEEK